MTAPTAFSALVNQLAMPAMAHIAMTYEAFRATFRAAAAVENLAYVPYTILDYFELLNIGPSTWQKHLLWASLQSLCLLTSLFPRFWLIPMRYRVHSICI